MTTQDIEKTEAATGLKLKLRWKSCEREMYQSHVAYEADAGIFHLKIYQLSPGEYFWLVLESDDKIESDICAIGESDPDRAKAQAEREFADMLVEALRDLGHDASDGLQELEHMRSKMVQIAKLAN